MGRVLTFVVGALLTLCGVGLIIGYAVILKTRDDPDVIREAALLGGLGLVFLIAVGTLLGSRTPTERRIRVASPWVSGAAFLALIAVGAVSARSERWPALDPILAVASVAAVAAFIAAIAMKWAPGHSANRRVSLGAGLWGMIGATSVALVLELAALIVLFGGGLLGLYLAEPELVRAAQERGLEPIINESGSRLATDPTVLIGLVALYAILAPMAEEFAKLLGTAIYLGRSTARYDAFTAGVFAGLGFAAVETLAYALAAGERWPLLVALRAPIALVHVTAASMASIGWQATQVGSRFAVFRGYAYAVLIHGSWNGLVVAVLAITASVGDSGTVPPVAGLILAGIVVLMGMHLLGCLLLLLNLARNLGREATEADRAAEGSPPAGPGTYFERMPTLSNASVGSA